MTARLASRLVSRLASRIALLACLLVALLDASIAAASPKEAGKHFSRGVALYNEADYRAALVEFKRAYELAPNGSVLYNIGQTYYQLQNYAAALATFERYLAEAGANASHRAEVEQSIDTLRARVGKVDVTTTPPGADIAIDDEPAGTTPLERPILVSIGRRKVTATLDGRPVQTRFVEVAAGDTVEVALALGGSGGVGDGVVDGARTGAGAGKKAGRGLVTAGWVTTGVLAAGAITFGALAFSASRDLDAARDTFPIQPAELDDKASRVRTMSLAADALTAAAIVAGGVSLYLTLTRPKKQPSEKREKERENELRVGLAPRGLAVAGTF